MRMFSPPLLTRSAGSRRELLQNAVLGSLDINLAVIDERGFVVEVSDTWPRFALANGGDPQSTGVGANYLDVCRRSLSTSTDAQQVLEGVLAVMEGRALRFRHQYRCDAPGLQRWFVMTVVPHPDIRGGAIISHRDDSASKRLELRYGELLDSVRAIVWRAEPPSFNTTFASKQAEDILGFPAEAWTSDQELWRKQIHPEDREWVLQYTSQEVAARRKHSFEYRIFNSRGQIVWLRNIVNLTTENDELKEIVGISVDVTDRRRAEEDRDQLQARLLRSMEQERSVIARELHDDIGQSLTILGFKLKFLKESVAPDSSEAAQAKELQALATRIAQDVQRVSHGLHSASLDLLGLASAVEQHCREYASHSAAEVQFEIKEIPRNVHPEIVLCIFRILQECLRNITKHSQAKHVMIRLAMESNQIQLQVTDDGVGFDPASVTGGNGLGLASISERIRLVHGKVSLSSAPGKGTQITASVPFRASE